MKQSEVWTVADNCNFLRLGYTLASSIVLYFIFYPLHTTVLLSVHVQRKRKHCACGAFVGRSAFVFPFSSKLMIRFTIIVFHNTNI